MLKNITVRPCCFEKYTEKELAQAELLRSGYKRFSIDKEYWLESIRVEDWEHLGWCAYVH